jgi:L-ribulose-5-phosphate 4-epimerase
MNAECMLAAKASATFGRRWRGTAPLPEDDWRDLNLWRQRLVALRLLGVGADGVAFGNLSARCGRSRRFIITGSQTSGLPALDERHFVEVEDFDLERHTLACRGPILPSSEALSHAAVYASAPPFTACLHVHHAGLWRKLFGRAPTTSIDGACGSAELAGEILRLLGERRAHPPRAIVMGGHPEGLLFMGRTLDEAGQTLTGELLRL